MSAIVKSIQVLALSASLLAQFEMPVEFRQPGVNRMLRILGDAGAAQAKPMQIAAADVA